MVLGVWSGEMELGVGLGLEVGAILWVGLWVEPRMVGLEVAGAVVVGLGVWSKVELGAEANNFRSLIEMQEGRGVDSTW